MKDISYSKEVKVACAVSTFEKEAKRWWTRVHEGKRKDSSPMMWDDFEKLFKEKYLSKECLTMARERFWALEQGSKTVKEYIREYEIWTREECVPTPMEERGEFVQSLNDKYRMVVIDVEPRDLEDTFHKALEIEELEEIKLQREASMKEEYTCQASSTRKARGKMREEDEEEERCLHGRHFPYF